ncbi:MAG: sulfatase [Akkermansiaceae bacterium]|nr:sulfatase [Akkermansiaceae bacterium]
MKTITLFLLSSVLAFAETQKPNFVFILADDLGIMDLSGEGSTFHETPNIDSIARDGMRFTQGYSTCQVCSPSRASIMTGKYPARHGVTDWIGAASGTKWNRNDKVLPAAYSHELDPNDTTLAEALAAGGYRTFFAGKWHIGKLGPEQHGFQVNQGGHDRGSPPGGYFSPYKNPKLTDGPAGESLPIRLANETAAFIKTNKDKPFLAYLSFYSVHGPIQTTPALWKKYRDKAQQNPHKGDRFLIDRTMPVRQVQDCPIYAGMMESMDNAVGIVLKQLDDLGLAASTVVIFTSDNGGVSSGDAFATSCLPLRGGKGRQWEGGIRQPYYIKAPGMTRGQSTCSTPVTGTDFYPTMLELAGLPLLPKQHVDGVSLVPLLKGKSIKNRALFWHYPHYGNQGGEPSAIIKKGDWKLIHYYEDGRDELYHLSKDIGEQNDLAAQQPEIAQTMRKELNDWLKETGARIPKPDKRFNAGKRKAQDKAVATKKKPALEKQHARFLDPDFKPNKDWWGSKVTED